MKYIILENQISTLFSQFMKQYDWKVWDYSDDEISVYNGYPGKRVFYTSVYNAPPDVEETEYTLYINYWFFNDILYGMFGNTINPWTIVRWFNDEFDSNCVTFEFFKLEDDDN